VGQFFHSETHEKFAAFIAMYEPFTHGLCPFEKFDGVISWDPPSPPASAEVMSGIYRHFKGRFYKAFGEFVHVDTGEVFVAYTGLYPSSAMLVRPRAMFVEHVVKPDYRYEGPRFTLIRPC